MQDIRHYGRFVGEDFVFLSRYQYGGQFGDVSEYCVVSNFTRNDWTFPDGLTEILDGKIVDIPFSVTTVNDEKTVGHWRVNDKLLPLSKITVSAFVKNGPDHIASQFYGLQLTATRQISTSNYKFN